MDLSFWQILALAVVQGITEFLPISSDGHLAVAAELLMPGQKPEDFVELNIVLHMGTLGSIVCYYWQRIWRLLGEDRRLVKLIVLGTIPAVAVGLPLREYGADILGSTLLAGVMLPVTGLLLIVASRYQQGTQEYASLTTWQALAIGCAQTFALLPGISRSGTTISTGLMLGLSPKSATTFSFLLALPAIAGAGVLEVVKMTSSTAGSQLPMSWLVLGVLTSFGVGLVAIWSLVRVLEQQRIHWFAAWCIPFGIAVTAWQLLAR